MAFSSSGKGFLVIKSNDNLTLCCHNPPGNEPHGPDPLLLQPVGAEALKLRNYIAIWGQKATA